MNMHDGYMRLSNLTPCKNAGPLRICIVTPDIMGPVRNGGIGTACTHLAQAFATDGHEVSVLFSSPEDQAASGQWIKASRDNGITAISAAQWANEHALSDIPVEPALFMAHIVYLWLREQSFDAVIFMDWLGHGFYTLQAKACGLHFQNTALIVQLHSPSLWHTSNNASLGEPRNHALVSFIERTSIELADALISPSASMLHWIEKHGFRTPPLLYVQPNLRENAEDELQEQTASVQELVFFGRLEYRKGLSQFCDALDLLTKQGIFPEQVTFLGKAGWMGPEHAGLYIARRAQNWPMPLSILPFMDQREATSYLRQPGRLAIMPSVADNSPCTVCECLAARIPFIASYSGGIPELILQADHAACLCTDNPHVLAEHLATCLKTVAVCPRPAQSADSIRSSWHTGFPALVQQIRAVQKTASALPFISVCLTHYERPELLCQAVASLAAQEYPHFEVILVDDGSKQSLSLAMLDALEPLFAQRGWILLRLQNGYLGKARNAAVRFAHGEYLLFMDDDNVARPEMLRKFAVAAAFSGADLITTVFDVFSGDDAPSPETHIVERYLAVGGAIACSTIKNLVGDANSLIRRTLFEKLGGFTEDYGLGHEDFELLLKAALSGAVTRVIPDSLFWYRRSKGTMLTSTCAAANRLRSLRSFIDCWPAPLAELAVLAHGLATESLIREEQKAATPAYFDDHDILHLSRRDPNSPESLLLVVDALLGCGQENAGQMLLRQLETPAEATHFALLQTQARFAAKNGDLQALDTVLHVFEETRFLKKDDQLKFFTAVLTALPVNPATQTRRTALSERLYQASVSIKALLTAAHHFSLAESYARCLEALNKALCLADAAYLQRRSDVAESITPDGFTCGLHHFVLYGVREGQEWPDADEFASFHFTHASHLAGLADIQNHTPMMQQFLDNFPVKNSGVTHA